MLSFLCNILGLIVVGVMIMLVVSVILKAFEYRERWNSIKVIVKCESNEKE